MSPAGAINFPYVGPRTNLLPKIFGVLLIFLSVLNTNCQINPFSKNLKSAAIKDIKCDYESGKYTNYFMSEVLAAWRGKARCNVVPAERTQELFHELSFHLTDKQITDVFQTAKMLAPKGSWQSNGLTSGEFYVLAADLKRFRTSAFGATSPGYCGTARTGSTTKKPAASTSRTNANCNSKKSLSEAKDCKTVDKQKPDDVQVFLGGSCNPTTWRADVAIPVLKKLDISYYNPQVSDWTPDLIELEHLAKEKARVLFFVMDSETRACASSIESAYIAGQNCKQLVLVMHPYKPNQSILNERLSQHEYIELVRNQQLLRELVTRRGLPVLDNIPSALQRTKEILADSRHGTSSTAAILGAVRGAFERVNPINELITVEKCQQALLYLGHSQSLVKMDNLKKIIAAQRQALADVNKNDGKNSKTTNKKINTSKTPCPQQHSHSQLDRLDFNMFCVISAYLSVLQQELQESGCTKAINLQPPPVLPNLKGEDFREVYLGGSDDLRTNWRQKLAIPYLKAKGISYHTPSLHANIHPGSLDLRGSSSLPANLYYPSELESSRILLFVITNDARSLAPMTLAAHCIGLMYNVVLSVEMLPNDCVIENEKLTSTAIKDYNRGRSYLIDLAKRQGVPVFNDIKAALEYTAKKIQS